MPNRTRAYSPLATSHSAGSVLADLAADAWFQAQHDVVTITRTAGVAPTAPVTGAFDAYDAWAGDLSEVHAFLTANPAF